MAGRTTQPESARRGSEECLAMLPALARVQGGRAVPEQSAVEQCTHFISKVMVELWSRLLVRFVLRWK